MKRLLLLFSALFLLSSLSFGQFQLKNTILEEFSGTWCGWCPDGAVIATNISNNFPGRAFVITVHAGGGDPMETTESAMIANDYNDGFPTGVVDRQGLGVSRNQWTGQVNSRLNQVSSIAVSFDNASFNASTREISVTVSALFDSPMTGDFVFNCFVVEDSVTGGGAYNQSNYLNGQAGHTYYQAGDPIVGFIHRHTLRAAMGGAWGTAGIIPTTINAQDVFTHTYTYTLPANMDENKINLIAYVGNSGNDVNSREILNAEEMHLPMATSIAPEEFNGFLEVGPNPFNEVLNIGFGIDQNTEVTIDVMNPMGQVVRNLYKGNTNAGAHSYEWNGTDNAGNVVANGVYLLTLRAGEQSITKRVMLSK